ncbi:MAG: IS110 family transposase [Sphingobacteriales bacterium]|nr:MAG: IS110 family transposase [Sphingobacteriales bacterium]
MNFSFTFKIKFMEKTFIGIDVSSETLDICIKISGSAEYLKISNQKTAIKAFLKNYAVAECVLAMENTGRYNWTLLEVLAGMDLQVYVIPPIHLKKSLGLSRGKNDKIDSMRICNYIEKNQNESDQWKASSVSITRLKVLLTERRSRIKMKSQLVRQQYDYKLMKSLALDKELLKLNKKLIEAINKQISEIESTIEQTIMGDNELKKQCELIRSVPGVGKIVSWTMIAKTEGFSTINDPRKMACYCGVVPFEHQSGTSIRGRSRVSAFADKGLKSMLHLAAMSAIRSGNELEPYYKRKVAEGKNKMSVLNAVRNKIIHRIFAVIKNQTMYKYELVLS